MVNDQLLDEHIFFISILSPWFADIANYLVAANFSPSLSSREKRKIVRKSAPFNWIGVNIFKLVPDHILRKCVREEEIFDILSAYHDGPCGGHFASKRTTFKALRARYYWPTLHQDARREIVTDQGAQFTSNFIDNLLWPHHIKHITYTIYHPQENGQVELTNRELGSILTKFVSNNKRHWRDILVEATWDYNTTWKTTIGFTPYDLLYGKKDLLSFEFEYNTLRMEIQMDLDDTKPKQERLL
eukprot:PITA_24422